MCIATHHFPQGQTIYGWGLFLFLMLVGTITMSLIVIEIWDATICNIWFGHSFLVYVGFMKLRELSSVASIHPQKRKSLASIPCGVDNHIKIKQNIKHMMHGVIQRLKNDLRVRWAQPNLILGLIIFVYRDDFNVKLKGIIIIFFGVRWENNVIFMGKFNQRTQFGSFIFQWRGQMWVSFMHTSNGHLIWDLSLSN